MSTRRIATLYLPLGLNTVAVIMKALAVEHPDATMTSEGVVVHFEVEDTAVKGS